MNFRQSFINILATAILLMLIPGGSLIGQQLIIQEDQSKLWIEGDSNVKSFTCDAEEYQADAQQLQAEQEEITEGANNLSVTLQIGVKGFDCGRRKMNSDLYEALKSDKFPYIEFTYTSTEEINYVEEDERYEVTVNGDLTVAGVTQQIRFTLDGFLLDNGNLRARGEKEINMRDYDVEPPVAMLGIVRVDEHLTVHFDLTAVLSDER